MSWIQVYSGKRFDPLDPRPEAVDILDIAHALSNVCRFNGHTLQFYSVAEHCYRASFIVPPSLALVALMHDAAEAYIGDTVRPLKPHFFGLADYEQAIHEAIAQRYFIPATIPFEVKQADLVMLATERRDLMAPTDDVWECLAGIEPLAETITPMSNHHARLAFLRRFEDLTGTMREAA